MFELARANWLWLFALTALFFAAYVLARRFRATRVTYGPVWHTVARKLRPPGWKRLLRTLLTLCISIALLSSVVLQAAGMQRPQAERPPALLVAIAVDCTPSMAARSGQSTRRELAWQRVHEILKVLGKDDRAVVFHFEGGVPLGSRWLAQGDQPPGPPPTDFAQPDLAALADAVKAMQPPPGVPVEPVRLRFIWWLGDGAPTAVESRAPLRLSRVGATWRDVHGASALVESFGDIATNDAITAARWKPTPHGPARGTLEFKTRDGGKVTLTGKDDDATKDYGAALHFDLTTEDENFEFRARLIGSDALPQDDQVEFTLPLPPLRRAHLAWPAADTEPNQFLLGEFLPELLPGVTLTHSKAGEPSPRHDLLICDRATPETSNARFALCFAALPAALGTTGPPIRVTPGLQRAERPESLGFELPDLAMLQGETVTPLAQSAGLRPLLKSPTGEVLIAEGTVSGTRVLYCGFTPHQSNLVEDVGGVVLLMRWLGAIRAAPVSPWPPMVNTGATVETRMMGTPSLQVALDTTPWEPCSGDRRFTLAPGLDGRAKLGPLAIPGNWKISDATGGVSRIATLWHHPAEQALPFAPLPRADLAALQPALQADWRDNLPAALLWIALTLLVLEWVLWLVGITE